MSKELALQKQEAITGGHTSYYLQVIEANDLHDETVVELEDIIDVLDIRFEPGCALKALMRLCKIRQNLGKPGSTPLYEAEKNLHYCKLTLTRATQRLDTSYRIMRKLHDVKSKIFSQDYSSFLDKPITVKYPKRLAPYSFTVNEFVTALGATNSEAINFKSLLIGAYLRTLFTSSPQDEVNFAQEALTQATKIEIRTKLSVTKRHP